MNAVHVITVGKCSH